MKVAEEAVFLFALGRAKGAYMATGEMPNTVLVSVDTAIHFEQGGSTAYATLPDGREILMGMTMKGAHGVKDGYFVILGEQEAVRFPFVDKAHRDAVAEMSNR